MVPFDQLVKTSDSSEFCIFGYDAHNLGDYVQVLAMLQHVRPRCYVLRDRLVPHRELTLVANGWLSHGPLPKRSDFARIVYAGVHIDHCHRSADTIRNMSECGTVGCRDTATLQYLRQHRVDAALTRCATLTFPRYEGPRDGLVLADVDPQMAARAKRRFARQGESLEVTHTCKRLAPTCLEDGSFIEHLRLAYSHLSIYRTASLVITSRIHVALPCLAFGTPVIYTGPKDSRFGVFEGIPIDTGWNRLRRINMLLFRSSSIPLTPNVDAVKAEFRDFLVNVLGDVNNQTEYRPSGAPYATVR